MIGHSKIFRGEVVHERLSPRRHAFTYPMTFFGFDLDELPSIGESVGVFGYNEARPLRINDRDYLYGAKTPILQQLDELLPPQESGQRTMLISSPRYLGYAFNPVNFHLRMEGDRLLCAVAEVNNTFGDRHVYPLCDLETVGPHRWAARCPKDFHVSPFNDMTGEYHFTFRIEAEEIFLGVDLYRAGACILKTWIRGQSRPLSRGAIMQYACLHPLDTALNSMPRILWQAALLHYKKQLEVYQRPSPKSSHTLIDRDSTSPRDVI
ncbi:MAG: DUF1365 domain-containing protein [Puniceicoccaceae bacterium]|nr:MAG: DUF1365 domain-containing protein [Puniceicoccaceae bacterium]